MIQNIFLMDHHLRALRQHRLLGHFLVILLSLKAYCQDFGALIKQHQERCDLDLQRPASRLDILFRDVAMVQLLRHQAQLSGHPISLCLPIEFSCTVSHQVFIINLSAIWSKWMPHMQWNPTAQGLKNLCLIHRLSGKDNRLAFPKCRT